MAKAMKTKAMKIKDCPKLKDNEYVCPRHSIVDQMVGVPFRDYRTLIDVFDDICKDCIQKTR